MLLHGYYSSFNPCFIGTYSFTSTANKNPSISLFCFNPCFIGTYSFTFYHDIHYILSLIVLILVLLELILLLLGNLMDPVKDEKF